jgi:hypothetical protein
MSVGSACVAETSTEPAGQIHFASVRQLFPKVPTRSHARLHSALLSSPAYAGRDHSLEGVVRSRWSSNGVQGTA